jgi:hypothetical protein
MFYFNITFTNSYVEDYFYLFILFRTAVILMKRFCKENPVDRIGYQKDGVSDIKKHRWFQVRYSWFQIGHSWFQVRYSWFQIGYSCFQV